MCACAKQLYMFCVCVCRCAIGIRNGTSPYMTYPGATTVRNKNTLSASSNQIIITVTSTTTTTTTGNGNRRSWWGRFPAKPVRNKFLNKKWEPTAVSQAILCIWQKKTSSALQGLEAINCKYLFMVAKPSAKTKISIHARACVHACLCAFPYTCPCAFPYICLRVFITHACVRYVYTHACACVRVYIHACVRVSMPRLFCSGDCVAAFSLRFRPLGGSKAFITEKQSRIHQKWQITAFEGNCKPKHNLWEQTNQWYIKNDKSQWNF